MGIVVFMFVELLDWKCILMVVLGLVLRLMMCSGFLLVLRLIVLLVGIVIVKGLLFFRVIVSVVLFCVGLMIVVMKLLIVLFFVVMMSVLWMLIGLLVLEMFILLDVVYLVFVVCGVMKVYLVVLSRMMVLRVVDVIRCDFMGFFEVWWDICIYFMGKLEGFWGLGSVNFSVCCLWYF